MGQRREIPEGSQPVDYSIISRIYDISRAANAETVEKLKRVLRVDEKSSLIDLGCGTGNYTFALQQITGFIVGIDINVAMLNNSKSKYPELSLIRGDIRRLPFTSEKFDGALVVQVLHHVKEKEIFLKEAFRVLRKGAFIAVHSCSHQQMRAFWFYHYFPRGLGVDLARIPDSGEVVHLLKNAGFSNTGREICFGDQVVRNETPQNYLDRNYRNGVSTFALLTDGEIESGCQKIKADLVSGKVYKIIKQAEIEVVNNVGGSTIVYGQKTGA